MIAMRKLFEILPSIIQVKLEERNLKKINIQLKSLEDYNSKKEENKENEPYTKVGKLRVDIGLIEELLENNQGEIDRESKVMTPESKKQIKKHIELFYKEHSEYLGNTSLKDIAIPRYIPNHVPVEDRKGRFESFLLYVPPLGTTHSVMFTTDAQNFDYFGVLEGDSLNFLHMLRRQVQLCGSGFSLISTLLGCFR